MNQFFTVNNIADILSVSLRTVNTWAKNGTLTLEKNEKGQDGCYAPQLIGIPQIESMINNNWDEEYNVKPVRDFTSIELFAGGGGLALGMEKAGFKHVLLNEFDKSACATLRKNRPNWNVVEGDIHDISFKEYEGKVDFLSGGFPCQAFSYAGNKGGFEDARGTLFFELARAVKEVKPKVFMGENVKGLYTHDKGHTFEVIKSVIADLGYTLVEPQVLKAIQYQVPQKRERLILIAIRNDIADKVHERKFMQGRRKFYIDGGEIEIVRPVDNAKFCASCSRLRITPDGKIKPCLLRNDNLVEIISHIRNGESEEELVELFLNGINNREPFNKED